MKIKAIIFDWVGVLLIKNLNSSSTSINLEKAIYHHKIKSKKELSDVLNKNIDEIDKVIEEYLKDMYKKYFPLWNKIEEIKNNYKFAVINNGPSLTLPYFDKIFNFKRYGLFINSEIEGVAKPDPEIFKRTLNKLNVEAENAIYMDDDPETSIITNLTGIHSFPWITHENGYEKLLNILKANNL